MEFPGELGFILPGFLQVPARCCNILLSHQGFINIHCTLKILEVTTARSALVNAQLIVHDIDL